MISFEEIQKYLPQYLSETSQSLLFEDLNNFPNNLDQRLYSGKLMKGDTIYQGDGIDGLMVINLPDMKTKALPVVIFSNSCDINPENKRYFPSRIVYAPIFQLEKYENMLMHEYVESGQIERQAINNHIDDIKKERITQILFLPRGCNLKHDSIVFLDRLNNYPVEKLDHAEIKNKKLFSFSNYGHYLFLIKLSIHFTRVRENVDRGKDS